MPPAKQLLRAKTVPPRYLRYNSSRQQTFGNNPPLCLRRPFPSSLAPNQNLNAPKSALTFILSVDHKVKSNPEKSDISTRRQHNIQGGEKISLTLSLISNRFFRRLHQQMSGGFYHQISRASRLS
jgi:hypothetical protein